MSGPTDIVAPDRAIAWSPSTGFIEQESEATDLIDDGALVLVVSTAQDDEMPLVRAVEGPGSLVAQIRADHDIERLARRLDDLHLRLLDIVEAALQRLAVGHAP